MGETIGDQLNQRAQEQDYGSIRERLAKVFGEAGAFKLLNRPLDMLGGKTPAEVLVLGSEEERRALETFVTYAETPPYAQNPGAQQ